MAYHNKVSASKFEKNATGAEKFSEQELMDAVNHTVVDVEFWYGLFTCLMTVDFLFVFFFFFKQKTAYEITV